jgi:hypothetical protein
LGFLRKVLEELKLEQDYKNDIIREDIFFDFDARCKDRKSTREMTKFEKGKLPRLPKR